MTVQSSSVEARPSLSQQLGRYQLVAVLGQGGMGTVYLALASGFGQFKKLLVVKELRQDLTRREGFVSMFMDEAKLAARLAHPNVVQTFEASEVGDRYFLAMEYLDGQSLSTLLDRLPQTPSSKLSLWMHIQILCDALTGLHYAHELLDYDGSSLQVVHRDVSPQNVFVTYHGQVKVVDFGVAKVANASVKTAPGMFVGKFSYAAPEQVLGQAVDMRTDVFAAGVMLWQAIAGRPFSDQAPTPAACRARTEGLEPRIREVVPSVDPMLARICDRALAVDPDRRFESAKAFRSELQEYMQRYGERVEAAEIGQLMHEVFDAERRSLHARIERAMRHASESEPVVDELSIYAGADKEPTAVADLSSLVEVSLERDDQKIRQGYAHSKVTLVRPPSEEESALPMLKSIHTQGRRVLTVMLVSAVVLIGVSLAVLRNQPRPERVAVKSLAGAPAEPGPAEPGSPPVQPTTLTQPQTVSEKVELAAASPAHGVHGSEASMPASSDAPALEQEHPAQREHALPAAAPSRIRARVLTPVRRSAHDAASSVPERNAASDAAGPQRAVEEGADLMFSRRAPTVHIDRENPYR